MAGAGIGTCVICGRDNQPLVNDICQDCTMNEFFSGLEKSPLAAGAVVHALNSSGHKVFNALYRVEEDFNGGWMDKVKLRIVDNLGNVAADVIERGRDKVTNQ
jgi:hypothetical protein